MNFKEQLRSGNRLSASQRAAIADYIERLEATARTLRVVRQMTLLGGGSQRRGVLDLIDEGAQGGRGSHDNFHDKGQ